MSKLKQGHASEMLMEAGRQWLHPGAGLWGTWVWKEGWMIEGCPCIRVHSWSPGVTCLMNRCPGAVRLTPELASHAPEGLLEGTSSSPAPSASDVASWGGTQA